MDLTLEELKERAEKLYEFYKNKYKKNPTKENEIRLTDYKDFYLSLSKLQVNNEE